MKYILEFIWDKSPWWLKGFMVIVAGPFGLGMGAIIFLDTYVIEKVNTATQPIQKEVSGVLKRQDDLVKAVDSRMNSMDEKLNILISR